jgi:hypothetical protein
MRRSLKLSAVGVLATAGLLFPGLAHADINLSLLNAYDAALAVDPTMPAPPTDGSGFAVGGFQGAVADGTQNNNNAFSAHFDHYGNAFGHLTETVVSGTTQTFKFRGDITCLRISGSDAAMGYVATESASNSLPPGSQGVLAVHDTGLPGGAGDTYAYYPGAAARPCSAYAYRAFFTIVNGNISVHDN